MTILQTISRPYKIINCGSFHYIKIVTCFCFSLFFLCAVFGLYAEDRQPDFQIPTDSSAEKYNRSIYMDIESRSGTPLVLNFVLKDLEGIVERVYFDFESDGYVDLEVDNSVEEKSVEEKVVFRGVPYRKRGIYTASIYLETEHGTFLREFVVTFTDFVWGRDNFSFANDGKFENTIDFVSNTVIDWAEDRFGDLTPDQEVLLLYVMYNIYKGSMGRCYGFSGWESYYLQHPEGISYPYVNTYSIDEWDQRMIREMDYAQNDIVFSNFVSGKIAVSGVQTSESLRKELLTLKESIAMGKPMILSIISKKIHHSMAAYGYFENKYRDKITVLVANNWERKSNLNSFSEDAESIVVQFVDASRIIKWYDHTKKKYYYLKKLFAIEREEEYDPAPEDLFSLLRKTADSIINDGKIIVMVEKTEEAYIVDENGKKIGYKKPKQFKELNKISFKKIDYNYVFEIPWDKENNLNKQYTLVVKKKRYNEKRKMYEKVNVFGIIPDKSGIHTEVFENLPVDENQDRAFIINMNGLHSSE